MGICRQNVIINNYYRPRYHRVPMFCCPPPVYGYQNFIGSLFLLNFMQNSMMNNYNLRNVRPIYSQPVKQYPPMINLALAQNQQTVEQQNISTSNYRSLFDQSYASCIRSDSNNIFALRTERDESIKTDDTEINPLNLTNQQLTDYGFNTSEKRDAFRKLKPEMQQAVIKLTEYAKSEGITITYNSKRSIFRTYDEQAEIYRTSRPGYAAKPGSSRHETGEAVDIKIPGANSSDKNDPQYKKLGQYWQSLGYTWGGTWNHCEPWHFDLRACA